MILVISASPNTDGLTAACAASALAGCAAAGAAAKHFDLCRLTIGRCRQCGNGWGQCRVQHTCIIDDDLAQIQALLPETKGIVFITPVYYGELAESAKCFLDRLRRCESTLGEGCRFSGIPVVAVAAAGGGGGGVTSCLAQLERYIHPLRGRVADLIGITRFTRAYTLAHIRNAAEALAAPVQAEA